MEDISVSKAMSLENRRDANSLLQKRVKRDSKYVSSSEESEEESVLYDNKRYILTGCGSELTYTEQATRLLDFCLSCQTATVYVRGKSNRWLLLSDDPSVKKKVDIIMKRALAVLIEERGPLTIPCMLKITSGQWNNDNELYKVVIDLYSQFCALLEMGHVYLKIHKIQNQQHKELQILDRPDEEEDKSQSPLSKLSAGRDSLVNSMDGRSDIEENFLISEPSFILQCEMIRHMTLHSQQQQYIMQLLNMMEISVTAEQEENKLYGIFAHSELPVHLRTDWGTTDANRINEGCIKFRDSIKNCRAKTIAKRAIRHLSEQWSVPDLIEGSTKIYCQNLNVCFSMLNEYLAVFPIYAHLFTDDDDFGYHNKMWIPWVEPLLLQISTGNRQKVTPPSIQQPCQATSMHNYMEAHQHRG